MFTNIIIKLTINVMLFPVSVWLYLPNRHAIYKNEEYICKFIYEYYQILKVWLLWLKIRPFLLFDLLIYLNLYNARKIVNNYNEIIFRIYRQWYFHALLLMGKKCVCSERRDPETDCRIYAPFRGFFGVTPRLASARRTLFRFDDIRHLLLAIFSPIATCLKPKRVIGYHARSIATRTEEGEIKCIGTIYAPGLTFSRRVTHGHPSRHRSP